MELQDFINRLTGAKKTGKGFVALCPAHDDKNPSLSVSNGGGKILLKCHAGCTPEAIVRAMGLSMKDLFTGNGSDGSKEDRPIIATHDYLDSQGHLLFQKARFATKPKTKPRHKRPDGKWRWGAGTVKRPLYRLPEISDTAEVVVVEGEKDVDSLFRLGFKATTTPFGKWEREHLEALSGKNVFIIGDNDKAGDEKVRKAAEFLQGHAKSIRIVELPMEGKPLEYDVSDFIAEFDEPEAAAEKLAILMKQAREPEDAKEAFPPLTLDKTQISQVLLEEPPDAEPLLTYNGTPVLTRRVVGGLTASGGTGKSYFLLQLAYALADGTGIGPLRAADSFRVLMLCGEDPLDEVYRRLWRIGKGEFPDGLCVASTAGQLPPLMHMVEGNPQRSPAYDWLKTTIENHAPLDVLILDPKSRFDGTDENKNEHVTAFITALESLVVEFGITVLFAHHVSKQNANHMGQSASRGASAIVDSARWMAGMTKMSEESAKRYELADPRHYIEFDITKSNYSAQLPAKFVFKRTENGLLEYAALEADRRLSIKRLLYSAIRGRVENFSRSDLIKNRNGADKIISEIKAEFSNFKPTNEIDSLIDELIQDGLIEEITIKSDGAGKPKKVLNGIPIDPENVYQKMAVK